VHPIPGGIHPGSGAAAGHPAGPVNEGRPPPLPVRSYASHPAPEGREEARAANGSVISKRPDGSRADIHDARRGMDIHYGLNGNRQVVLNRVDHSRVFAERGGRGYVQRPYLFRGQEFAQRTYWDHGHEYARFYGRYPYHGVYLEVYAPVRFYSVGFYGWVHTPWSAHVRYAWGWRGTPWFGYYGYYFAPYPAYVGPSFWLTDYLIATSLQAAYAEQMAARARAAAAANGDVELSPEVKDEIADEVKLQVQQETAAAQANAANSQGAPDDGGVSVLLSDGSAHVFVTGAALDLVDAGGNECLLTPGDVVQVRAAPAYGAQAVSATVLASKGGNECAQDSTVRVGLIDLQEMENHMRATIELGMADLQSRQGTGNLPAAPAAVLGPPVNAGFAASGPPPDANVGAEIAAQLGAADQAENEDAQ
jgi:hypothetical protein